MRLPRFKPMVYDRAVTKGALLLSISKLDEPSVNQYSSILSAVGAGLQNRVGPVALASASAADRT